MLILGISTSSNIASVALSKDAECIKELNFVYIDLGQTFKNVDLTFIIVKKCLANSQFTPTFDKA